ncbi:E-selectin-like [Carassius auratus]|uniref:E-selectin-like n=1 Tax=Carassius auratus TaxID=7957 RepID=A0A6P6PKG7_CARAU|nr:E-selectin-like [Carassius auratus]
MRIDLTFVLISALSSSVNSDVFTLVSEKMNWTDARSYCRQHHTDLVTLNDRTDMDELLQSLPSGLVSLMWIGLYRTDEYFPWVWVWSDGSKDLFTSWDPSQPNNVDGVQYCVCTSPKGYWSDWWCTDKLPFLCYTKKRDR